jgi:thioredoxin reductase (NADPH)
MATGEAERTAYDYRVFRTIKSDRLLAGVFAIGDVRSGSVKRVAAAVGEGAAVVAALHQYLKPQLLAHLEASNG